MRHPEVAQPIVHFMCDMWYTYQYVLYLSVGICLVLPAIIGVKLIVVASALNGFWRIFEGRALEGYVYNLLYI